MILFPCESQHDSRDCGPAALSTVCAYYGKRLPIAKIRTLADTDVAGTNIYGMVNAARKLGFTASALHGSLDDLEQGIDSTQITLPFIAHIVNEQGLPHYVTVYDKKGENYFIADPAKGREKLKICEFEKSWTGNIIALSPSDEFEKEDLRAKFSHLAFNLLAKQKKRTAAVILCALAIAAIGIITAFVFKLIVDEVLVSLSTKNALETLAIACGSVILLYLVDAGIKFMRGRLAAVFSNALDEDLMMGFYSHALDLPMNFFGTRKTGELMSRFEDTVKIRDATSSVSLSIVVDGIMSIVGFAILWSISPQLTVIAFCMIVLYAVVMIAFRSSIRKTSRATMESNAQVTSYLKESLDGIETIKGFGKEHYSKAETLRLVKKMLGNVFRQSVMFNDLQVITGLISSVGVIAVLWMGTGFIIEGNMTLGSLLTFNALLGYFLGPVGNLISLQPTIQNASIAMSRLDDVTSSEKEDYENGHLLPEKGSIDYRRVSFRYGQRELALKDVSFHVPFGSRIAIVGESGSGKTTIAKLLVRFHEPTEGDILIGGTGLGLIKKSEVRKKIAYLSQDTFLFADTIMKNILYGNEECSVEKALAVCRLCKVDEFVERMPLRYETRLEENGTNLSGGQRQRIALARAMIKDPELLILDEATSNLDVVTEQSINKVLEELHGKVTCIVIAHRLSTIVGCDNIIVTDSGSVIEQGSHKSLIEKGGKYASFWGKP